MWIIIKYVVKAKCFELLKKKKTKKNYIYIYITVFIGLQCFETVFSKPISGSPEDFSTDKNGKF